MSAWQPIETAPTDQRVLVFNPLVGSYTSNFASGEWSMHSWDGIPGVWYPRPSHWMPLPERPE